MSEGEASGVQRASFHSVDIGEAEAFLAATYNGVSLEVAAGGPSFEFRHDGVMAGGLMVSRFVMRTGFSGRIDPVNAYVIDHVRSGGLSWGNRTYGEVAGAVGTSILAPPVGEIEHHSEPLDLDVVSLDMSVVAELAEQYCGTPARDVEFLTISPVSSSMNKHWIDTIDHVRDDVLSNPFASESPILLQLAERQVATALLSTFPNTALDRLTDPDTPAPRGTVPEATLREVVDYLHSHADRPIGPTDLADLAGMPVREIIAGLRRRRGVHPAQLLWNARLLGAYRDLRDADRASESDVLTAVARIAARWGFATVGSFRVAFARAFDGDLPERVLGRQF